MAEMTIRLRTDPDTGKREIIVALRSDPDALPHEHEQQHRAIVEKLIEGGIIKASESGQVLIECIEEDKAPTPSVHDNDEQERRKLGTESGG